MPTVNVNTRHVRMVRKSAASGVIIDLEGLGASYQGAFARVYIGVGRKTGGAKPTLMVDPDATALEAELRGPAASWVTLVEDLPAAKARTDLVGTNPLTIVPQVVPSGADLHICVSETDRAKLAALLNENPGLRQGRIVLTSVMASMSDADRREAERRRTGRPF